MTKINFRLSIAIILKIKVVHLTFTPVKFINLTVCFSEINLLKFES